MSKTKVRCEHCGALNVEYPFPFSRGLAKFLYFLAQSPEPVYKGSLPLSDGQKTNAHKLRYWGLAEEAVDDSGKRRTGWWRITPFGLRFVLGEVTITRTAIVLRNKVLRFEGPEIHYSDRHPEFQRYEDFVAVVRNQLLTVAA